MKLISDGDISGALMVTDNRYDVDIFLGIGECSLLENGPIQK